MRAEEWDQAVAYLEQAIQRTWPKPKALILSFPHNPTTRVVDRSFFERIVDFDYTTTLLTARINSLGTSQAAEVVEATETWLAEDPLGDEVVVGGFGPLFVDLVDAIVQIALDAMGGDLGPQELIDGALLAAEWLVGKKGVFGMKDVLNLR